MTAILDPVGDGDIVVSVLDRPAEPDWVRRVPDTRDECLTPSAEIGELLLVRDDWRSVLPPAEASDEPAPQIDLSPAAISLIAAATTSAAPVLEAIEAENRLVETQCFDAAHKLLGNRNAPLSPADRARLMLLLGMTGGLANFIADAHGQDPGNSELVAMHSVLRALSAEDELRPSDLLERGYGLLNSGALIDADRVFADGIARFPSEIGFFIQSAWIAYRLKNWPDAKQRWQTVINYFPGSPVGYLGLGMSLSEAGDVQGADEVLTSAMSLFPDNADVARHYARHKIAPDQ